MLMSELSKSACQNRGFELPGSRFRDNHQPLNTLAYNLSASLILGAVHIWVTLRGCSGVLGIPTPGALCYGGAGSILAVVTNNFLRDTLGIKVEVERTLLCHSLGDATVCNIASLPSSRGWLPPWHAVSDVPGPGSGRLLPGSRPELHFIVLSSIVLSPVNPPRAPNLQSGIADNLPSHLWRELLLTVHELAPERWV